MYALNKGNILTARNRRQLLRIQTKTEMNLKSFNKEEAFKRLFKEMDAMSKLTDVSDQILRYVKIADFLEKIAIDAYEEGFKDAVDQSLNNPN